MQDDIVIPVTGHIELLKPIINALVLSSEKLRMHYLVTTGKSELYLQENETYNKYLSIYFNILEHEKLNTELKERLEDGHL